MEALNSIPDARGKFKYFCPSAIYMFFLTLTLGFPKFISAKEGPETFEILIQVISHLNISSALNFIYLIRIQ